MSKASEWASKAVRPWPEEATFSAVGPVAGVWTSGRGYGLILREAQLSPADALALAYWIIATFGEPMTVTEPAP